jgi:hypothetical protein
MSSASDQARIGFLQNLVDYLANTSRSGPASRPTGDIIFNCGAGGSGSASCPPSASASCPPQTVCPPASPASPTSEISLQDISTKGRYRAQDIETIAEAINIHLQKFCDDWNFERHFVKVYPPKATVNATFRCYIGDTSDVGYALGYHTVSDDGVAVAYSFIETIGPTRIFTDPDAVSGPNNIRRGVTVPSVLCHEIFETLTNYYINKMVLFNGSMSFYNISHPLYGAIDNFYENIYSPNTMNDLYIYTECANPVQANLVPVAVGGKTVELSDYVLPTWFSNNANGPYSYLKTIRSAFQIDLGGYVHFKFLNTDYFNSRPLVI